MPKTKPRGWWPPSLPTLIAAGTLFAVALYAGFALLPLLLGPTLMVGVVRSTEFGTTMIAGTTDRVSTLSINGLPVPITEAGDFSIERAYPVGYTVVVIEASDRFGRRETETITLTTNETTYARKKEEPEDRSLEGGSDSIEDGVN